MIFNQNFGVTVLNDAVARDVVMPWPLYVAGPVASAGHRAAATHGASTAIKRRAAAAATVASMNRGPI